MASVRAQAPSSSLGQSLATQLGGDAADYLSTASGVFRRIYFDLTTAAAADWTGDTASTFTALSLTDQSGTVISCERWRSGSPTTWGIVSGQGIRSAGDAAAHCQLRFTPAAIGWTPATQGLFIRWGVTREASQNSGSWSGIRLEPSSGSADYLRANCDLMVGAGDYDIQSITRRSSTSATLTANRGASALTSFLQEVYFCTGAYRFSNAFNTGTTRPADVGGLTLAAQGSHEDRDTAIDASDYAIAYIQPRLEGAQTIKWLEFLIPLFKVVP